MKKKSYSRTAIVSEKQSMRTSPEISPPLDAKYLASKNLGKKRGATLHDSINTILWVVLLILFIIAWINGSFIKKEIQVIEMCNGYPQGDIVDLGEIYDITETKAYVPANIWMESIIRHVAYG